MMTIRAKFSLANDAFVRSLMIFAAALLLLVGFAVGSLAHADDFAAGNAVLLDPFDPVPQIHFSDCDRGCGRCDDDCGYRRCYDGCRRHIHRPPPVVIDDRSWCERMTEYDYNTHRWDGSMERYDHQADQYNEFMKNRFPHEWLLRHEPPDPGSYPGLQHDPCFYLHDGGDDGRGNDGHHDDGRHDDDHHDGGHHDDGHHDGDHHDGDHH